ncbi:LLM class flavin-dependent oxidoreductase [Paractinoplanes durhamensis]|uniref:LLM class flavin-dependent oxidoreductase n=1 Tax=Paractinoplanes durhamensis TaxID=113563 RepID=UPI003625B6BC
MAVRGWRRPYPAARPRIPIYLAAVGPAMLRLTAQIADGWLSHELCPPSTLRDQVRPVLGSRKIDIVASACCSVDADAGAARRRAANVVGFYASVRSYADMFAAAGFAEVTAMAGAALRAGRPADSLGDLIPDEMVDAYAVAGTPAECVARLKQYDGLADGIKLSPPSYGLDADEVRAAQHGLLELVGSHS